MLTKYTFIFYLFFFFKLSYGCHPSCICDSDSSKCISCVLPNLVPDKYQRSCPCLSGYFISSLNPFQCDQFKPIDAIISSFDQCRLEIGMEIPNFKIITYNDNVKEQNIQYFISQIGFDTTLVCLSQECQDLLKASFEIFNPALNGYEPISDQYITTNSTFFKEVKYPLQYIEQFQTNLTIFNDNTSSYHVNFRILISSPYATLKEFTLTVFFYVSFDSTVNFSLSSQQQLTEPFLVLKNIVVADVELKSFICKDALCNDMIKTPDFQEGETFYAKIYFADPTYTKFLGLTSLFVKLENGKIFDYTKQTSVVQNQTGMYISLPISFSSKAIIQVNVFIENSKRLRILDEKKATYSPQFQFELNVSAPKQISYVSNTPDSNLSTILSQSYFILAICFLFSSTF